MLFALIVAASACADANAPEPAAPDAPARPPAPLPIEPGAIVPRNLRLVAVSDSGGAAIAGAMAYAPTVRIVNAQGRPVPGMPVRFEVMGREGRVDVERTSSDGSGTASAGRWSTGPSLGTLEVRAWVDDSTWARFRLTAVPATGPLAVDGQCPTADSRVPTGWRLPKVTRRL